MLVCTLEVSDVDGTLAGDTSGDGVAESITCVFSIAMLLVTLEVPITSLYVVGMGAPVIADIPSTGVDMVVTVGISN